LDAPPASPPDEETRILAASGATGSSTALLAFGRVYSNYLETHPIATKSVTAAVLFAISDQMAQAFEIQRARKRGTDKSTAPILTSTDKKRSMWSGLVGFTYFGPTSHYWCVKKKFIPNICSVLFFFCHDDSIHLTSHSTKQPTTHLAQVRMGVSSLSQQEYGFHSSKSRSRSVFLCSTLVLCIFCRGTVTKRTIYTA